MDTKLLLLLLIPAIYFLTTYLIDRHYKKRLKALEDKHDLHTSGKALRNILRKREKETEHLLEDCDNTKIEKETDKLLKIIEELPLNLSQEQTRKIAKNNLLMRKIEDSRKADNVKSVENIGALANIPYDVRYEGMTVYVQDEERVFYLSNDCRWKTAT